MRGNRDLEILVAAALGCALAALLCPIEVISLIFAAPLALFLPGFAIASAALAGRGVERSELFILSLGLSLALLALGGPWLNYLGGLRALPWALFLALIVIGGCRVTALRRTQPLRAGPSPRRWARPTALSALMLGGGVLAATAAIALAFVPLPAKHAIGYSELWMAPFQRGGKVGVRVGIASNEQQRASYRLWVRLADRPTPLQRRLSLAPGQKRVLWLSTAPPARGSGVGVVARLYREGRPPRPNLRVTGWVPTLKASHDERPGGGPRGRHRDRQLQLRRLSSRGDRECPGSDPPERQA